MYIFIYLQYKLVPVYSGAIMCVVLLLVRWKIKGTAVLLKSVGAVLSSKKGRGDLHCLTSPLM